MTHNPFVTGRNRREHSGEKDLAHTGGRHGSKAFFNVEARNSA